MNHLLKLGLVFFCTATLAFGQEIRRPSADSTTTAAACPGVNQASSAMPLSHDSNGLSTFSNLSQTGGPCRSFFSGNCRIPGYNYTSARRFTNWQNATVAYTSLVLNVNSVGSKGFGGLSNNACVSYSTDAGASFTAIHCSTSWAQTTDTVTLAANQDLTKLIVLACVATNGQSDSSDASTSTVGIWDIWTSGATSGGSNPGNGSGSGQQPSILYISRRWKSLRNLLAVIL